jgi:deoxyribodipyrimidine photo-lyase
MAGMMCRMPEVSWLRRASIRANLSATMTTIVWFRQDLRVADNPALAAALEHGGDVIPVYLHAPQEEGDWPPGAASRWWLHHSLASLGKELGALGSRLILLAPESCLSALIALAQATQATRIVWNRRYEPAIIERDTRIKTELRGHGIETASYNSALLNEPWTVLTKGGSPFQVFTPYWRHCKARADPTPPLPAPQRLPAPRKWPRSASLASLGLLPRPDWAAGLRSTWTPGSHGARVHLDRFVTQCFDEYATLRDRPGTTGTSRLSPHLHFGEIGPREIWHAIAGVARSRGASHDAWRDSQFLTELGWRECAYHLLYHFPRTPLAPLRANYARFPWRDDDAALAAWQRGATGYPLVDAGLRELWHSGWMHNRARMIVGSFLIKDLLLDWTTGARWFWDTLVDADLASNTLGWQWVAGCGADAAPFFRIFNPTTQARRFDADGAYIRRWIPELRGLPDEWIHRPWEAPAEVLGAAGIRLGEQYPRRLVDHDTARQAALAALKAVRVG